MAQKLNTSDSISSGLTAQHIATNLANYEAARSNHFELIISDLSNFMKTNYTGGIDAAQEADLMNQSTVEEVIKLNVTKFNPPRYTVGVDKFTRGNDEVRFASKPTWEESSELTIDDLVGLDTKSILYAWLRLAYDPATFKVGRMKDYKKTCTLIEYTADYEPIRTWTIFGCWIAEIGDGEFDKEGDGTKRQLTAKVVYDRAIMETPEN